MYTFQIFQLLPEVQKSIERYRVKCLSLLSKWQVITQPTTLALENVKGLGDHGCAVLKGHCLWRKEQRIIRALISLRNLQSLQD
jgi:hypothetical protein